ncbi:LysR family transcriptional regulator [Altererythrobacter sp. FM1]|uniref:LysR family transcriptional regulator n=1 Tax=Tsuneonella flava TaxID=2055955 RepID=UPI000C80B6C7|nr:LysR family transcriptional regulator [Tsuneonella flava]ROT94166.1 LysR family transcriptional regulator [Altererythrobacter sp. FM1]
MQIINKFMELKWLEDFVCVAQQGHFARAADARRITQSALSRRVKSLEEWVGVTLLDRTQHPIRLTAAGREFYGAAQDIIRQSYDARSTSEELTQGIRDTITVSSLHTLALYFVPSMLAELQRKLGPFEVSVVAETRTVDEYLVALAENRSDFFVSYSRGGLSAAADSGAFESKLIGRDQIRPFIHNNAPDLDLDARRGLPIPYLAYSGTTLMSQLVRGIISNAPFQNRLNVRYRASLAESIRTAASFGMGLCWLPDSTFAWRGETNKLRLIESRWQTEVSIRIYKSRNNLRPIVQAIWDSLETL